MSYVVAITDMLAAAADVAGIGSAVTATNINRTRVGPRPEIAEAIGANGR